MTALLYEGAIRELALILSREGYERVLFVVDEDAYRACGAESVVEAAFADRLIVRFVGFALNPKLKDVERGIRLAKDCRPEVVLALGGGTAIDLGKLIGSLSVQTANAREIISGRDQVTQNGLPLIAIPTTAGTGSEATHFAVAYVKGEKFSVAHESLLPDFSIVDPQLTHSLPASITAATGLDALCQAIESIWAVGATAESIGFATEAAKIAVSELDNAVNVPCGESRLAMCSASHLAGKAINISKTTAPHALSYGLTSIYGIPHGIAVALMLRPILTYNAEIQDHDCADPRGAQHVRKRMTAIFKLLKSQDVHQAGEYFSGILKKLNCPLTLAEAGVRKMSQLRKIVGTVNVERMSNNPRKTDFDSLLRILSDDRKH